MCACMDTYMYIFKHVSNHVCKFLYFSSLCFNKQFTSLGGWTLDVKTANLCENLFLVAQLFPQILDPKCLQVSFRH